MDAFLVNKRIDLVDFDGLKLFMLEDDNLYRVAVPENRKHQDLGSYQQSLRTQGTPPSPVTPANVSQVTSARYGPFVVMHHLWERGTDFVVLDIGSHIGDFGLKVGNFIRTCGRNTKVITFDPSEAGALVPYSIELNQLEGIIKHEMLAVSDHGGLVLFRYRPGHAEAAEIAGTNQGAVTLGLIWLKRFRQLPLWRRIKACFSLGFAALRRAVWSGKVADSYATIVHSVDILDYLEHAQFDTNVFAKIDIEGHDPQVINRLLNLLPQRKIFVIFEFTPIRFADHQAASQYLARLAKDFYIFDLFYCPNPTRCQQIAPDRLSSFVTEVSERPQGYTDVFLLDKRAPDCEELLKRLGSLVPEPDMLVL
jgi:FkbM family methyltransferase